MMEDWNKTLRSYAVAILCLSYVSVGRCFLTEDMRSEIVSIHNTLRRNFAQGSEGVIVANMKKLVWKGSLEEEARRKLLLHCTLSFFHFPNSNKYSNIARNSNGNFTSDILNWFSAIKTYRFYPDFNTCYPPEECWQATSMLDALHRNIGCSFRSRCQGDSGGALLCLYENNDPDNQKTLTDSLSGFYRPGALCTHCSHPTGFCDEGLCTSCDNRYENCDCRKSCYAAGTGSGTLNQTTCSCTCQYGLGLNCDEPCSNKAEDQFAYEYDICTTASLEDCREPDVQAHCALSCNICEEILFECQKDWNMTRRRVTRRQAIMITVSRLRVKIVSSESMPTL